MRQNKGITLIALIITIIIMLILVGVTIDVAIDGKIFNTAKEAVDKTNEKTEEEQNRIDELTNELYDTIDDNSVRPIYTKEQFMKIGSDEIVTIEQEENAKYKFKANDNYVLKNNIDLSGSEWEALPTFSGTLDGNNFSINGLTKNDASLDSFGLFVELNGANIKNLALTNINITAHRTIGSFCVAMSNSTIENCFVTGNMDIVAYGGGITGLIGPNSTIKNCYTTCSINSSATGGLWSSVGGIAGWSAWAGGGGIIENCYSTSQITANNPYVGSIIGYNEDSEIRNCYALSSNMTGAIIYRVIGCNIERGVNNYAYKDMLINEEVTSCDDANKNDGCDATLEEITTKSHYETKGLWEFDNNGPWTFEYSNVEEGTNLPILKSFISIKQSPKI